MFCVFSYISNLCGITLGFILASDLFIELRHLLLSLVDKVQAFLQAAAQLWEHCYQRVFTCQWLQDMKQLQRAVSLENTFSPWRPPSVAERSRRVYGWRFMYHMGNRSNGQNILQISTLKGLFVRCIIVQFLPFPSSNSSCFLSYLTPQTPSWHLFSCTQLVIVILVHFLNLSPLVYQHNYILLLVQYLLLT